MPRGYPSFDIEHKKALANAAAKRYARRHPEKVNAANKRYRLAHPEKVQAWEAKREPGKHYRQVKEAIFQKLGKVCRRCGITDPRVLCIDHVNGGGNREVKSMSVYPYYKKVLNDKDDLYQILCQNCNWIKRHERREIGSGRPRKNRGLVANASKQPDDITKAELHSILSPLLS